MVSNAQNISVTFSVTGAATQIDSVTATNLATNQRVTLPGNETLVLKNTTGIPGVQELANPGMVFPNPFSGRATFTTSILNPQIVYLLVQNLVGQVVSQTSAFVQPGENQFELSVATAGIYLVTLTTAEGTSDYKAICTETTSSQNTIQYLTTSTNPLNPLNVLKGLNGLNVLNPLNSYSLGYSEGDVILYRCHSDVYTTILTDSPTSSKNYEVEFVPCTDRDRKNYAVVKIGYQTWMAENLAWLPFGNGGWIGPDSKYCVYGYWGNSISEAKATSNYINYGVLYQWDAALTACPAGWHLPGDEEWKVLETSLGMNQAEADSYGGRGFGSVSKKLKSTSGWVNNGNGENSSGFTALPAGYSYWDGDYIPTRLPGEGTRFWSATEYGGSRPLFRDLDFSGDAVGRSDSHKRAGLSVRCVKDGNIAPVASFDFGPRSGTTSTTFQFDASGSSDHETASADVEVRWDWNGDSIWDTEYNTTKTLSHQYTAPGSWQVTLEVKNSSGLVDRETRTVIVGEGIITDSRDGRVYAYKTIGTQTWMLENLAWMPTSGTSWGSSAKLPLYYVYSGDNVYSGGNVTSGNYNTYGTLYNYIAALTACPAGWHLPGEDEWTLLIEYLTNNGYGFEGSGRDIAKSLAAPFGWPLYSEAGTVGNDQTSNNSSGFTALPGGHWYGNAGFRGGGGGGTFWSYSNDDYSQEQPCLSLGYGSDSLYRNHMEMYSGLSVRCVKDSTAYAGPKAVFSFSPAIGTTTTPFQFDASGSADHETATEDLEVRWDWNGDGTWDTGYNKTKTSSFQFTDPGVYPVVLEVKDGSGLTDSLTINLIVGDGSLTDSRDGHRYIYKTIGTQTWMIENLAYLPSVNSSSDKSETSSFYYVYGYECNNVEEAKTLPNYATYGVLYNWEAAKTACPRGWHLSDQSEWADLIGYLKDNGFGYGEIGYATGKSMAATSGWDSYPFAGKVGNDQASNNRSGFSARPGGYASPGVFSKFESIGYMAYWWSTSFNTSNVSQWGLTSTENSMLTTYHSKGSGLSVRCLKGSPAYTGPTAGFSVSPMIGTPSTHFQFDASGCTDAETETEDLEVRWDWNGDGTWDTAFSKMKNSSFQYTAPGAYSVILEVKGSSGLADTETKTVTVGDGTLTDSRDGREYAYRNFGTQTWMIGNLAWLPAVSTTTVESETDPLYYVYGYSGSSLCEAMALTNYTLYGVLYNWEAAKTACPPGWHLPADGEWKVLETHLGMSQSDADRVGYRGPGSVSKALKSATGWNENGNGDNSSGFAAVPAGSNPWWYGGLGIRAFFWSSSEGNESYAWYRDLYFADQGVGRGISNRTSGYSVRCVKGNAAPKARFSISSDMGTPSTIFEFDAAGSSDNETASAGLEVRWDWNGDSIWDTGFDKTKTISHSYTNPGSWMVVMEVRDSSGLVDSETKNVTVGNGSLTDSRDGLRYIYKTIGTQTWMIENLAWLPAVSPSSKGSETNPLYYVYGYEGSNVKDAKAAINYNTYGVLYNWEAAKTACPAGWHLPDDGEWKVLETFLGMSQADADAIGWSRYSGEVGAKLKETGTAHWVSPNTYASNTSGFKALPGGGFVNSFYGLSRDVHFWSASGKDDWNAWERSLGNEEVYRGLRNRWDGISVRCLKNLP